MLASLALSVLCLVARTDAASSGASAAIANAAPENFTCAQLEPPADVKQAVQEKIKAHLASRANANARVAFETVNININWHVIAQARRPPAQWPGFHTPHTPLNCC